MTRLLAAALAMLIGLHLTACAEPECPEGTYKVGNVCRRNDAGTDAAAASGETLQNDAAGSTETSTGNIITPNAATEAGAGTGASPTHDAATAQPVAPDAAPMSITDAAQPTLDASSPQPRDPCEGIPQCVACTMDSQCPDPGACMVKHCATTKGICEPGFTPAQSACGTSKCDGSGHCVGCVGDSDCGAPGECKMKYCNQTTHVCEPKNASDGTACSNDRHCVAGACVECTVATVANDCADRTCETRSCVSGQCRYADVPAGQRGNCATGICTATQTCRECVGQAQCTRFDGLCTEGRCVDNACQSWNKTGACGSLKMCSGSTCVNSCGNAVTDTQAGEQCDPTAPFMNTWMCNSLTCQNTGLSAGTSGTSYRRRCSSNANCATNEMCVVSPQLGALLGQTTPICVPQCDSGQCRRVPGYILQQTNQSTACSAQGPCLVSCTTDADCPPNVTCAGSLCGGPFY